MPQQITFLVRIAHEHFCGNRDPLLRRAYGYREEDNLLRKIIAAFLPPLTRSAEKDPR